MEALSLVCGAAANEDLIRPPAQSAEVEAHVYVHPKHLDPVRQLLAGMTMTNAHSFSWRSFTQSTYPWFMVERCASVLETLMFGSVS